MLEGHFGNSPLVVARERGGAKWEGQISRELEPCPGPRYGQTLMHSTQREGFVDARPERFITFHSTEIKPTDNF